MSGRFSNKGPGGKKPLQGRNRLEVGHIVLDLGTREVRVDGRNVKLTPKDYCVAKCLLQNLGRMLSRADLLKEAWGIDAPLNTRTVDVHVSRVRKALQLVPERGYLVKTIYQLGYCLQEIDK